MRTPSAIILGAAVVLTTGAASEPPRPAPVSPRLQQAIDAASPRDDIRAWVFFSDKGGAIDDQVARAERALTPRSKARRERNGVRADARDVPVAPAYVRAVSREGARVRHASRWLNAVSVEADRDAFARLAALPFVTRLDLVRAFREPLPAVAEMPEAAAPRSPALALDYGPSFSQNASINVPALHDQGYTGAGVLVALLDAGFNNLAHDAFASLDVMATWDFVNGDSIVSDQVGQMGSGNHGTYTLSAIGGFKPGLLIGPAFGATYLLAKTENTDWERHVEEDDWIAGAEWADSIGADVISSSLGYSTGFTHGEPSYSWTDMDGNTTIVALGADAAAGRGIVVVNSAGNGGFVSLPANTLASPADGDSVLAVGAVDGSEVRAVFSSVGPSSDGQVKPDVMALGVGVVAASPIGTSYVAINGTSMACPLVAGVAALLLDANPAKSAAEILDALRSTADRAGAPDREYGYGMVDAQAAAIQVLTGVGTPASPRVALHAPHPNPFNPNTTIRYHLAVPARVALSIYDVRGARVAALVDQVQSPGARSVVWNARDERGRALPSGVYFCRLEAAGELHTRKLVLLK